ncbi:DUF6492 family protein [Pseudobacteriovorax antillogorgiicola]|uniref:Glycosyl transferase family 8 n=1 Tax=Pseudobacteriovorax antillogorgiicola TaxID=1513793 RepID=A0A1Y6CUZ3_9BACT|nr:DUF6492 family protein [Pseudobacteriovorax antillogorgiicola]TCS43630.1 hypothetical protein EDD56_13523 [Pseudobacteriovorax antillogorgiicola]SMF80002.1 hypothetical protein SAMN06296036_13430 [Pseudobacteriovorax antillogorgiicola]
MKLDYGIVTPSYHADFESCRILVASIESFIPKEIPHYLIIPKADLEQFQAIRQTRTRFLFQEDFMPPWLHPIPFTKKRWWYSFKTPPVRGWVRQQLIKLGIPAKINHDYYILMDSDSFFLKPFQLEQSITQAKVPLYCEPTDELPEMFQRWNRVSAKILKIPLSSIEQRCYVGICIFWSKQLLNELLQYIEKQHRKPWQEVICSQIQFSEYTLYGIFAEYVLGELNSPQALDPTIRTLDYWQEVPLQEDELEQLTNKIEDHHIGGMISAKSGTKADAIAKAFGIELMP